MIFEVKCDELTYEELTDRTHTHIVSFIVLDEECLQKCDLFRSWCVVLGCGPVTAAG